MFNKALEIIRAKLNNAVALESVESWLIDGSNDSADHAKLDAWAATLGFESHMNENVLMSRVLQPVLGEELAEEVFEVICGDD